MAPPGTISNAGVISLLRGSPTGLAGGQAVELSQGYECTPDTSEPNDRFGHDVRVLDLEGRSGLDAIVSSPGEHGEDVSLDSRRGNLVEVRSPTPGV